METALITGGTGFIGRALCADLLADGWQVDVLTRDTERAAGVLPQDARAIDALEQARLPDAAINLAGENLASGRWTQARKKEMRESRLRTTRALTAYLATLDTPLSVLVSGSAVGFYGACGEVIVDETQPQGDEFQAELCADWEAAALEAKALGTRVCLIRTGLVLGAREGALAQMITPFKFGLGGPLGSGRQYMPWIHIRDEVRAIRFLIAQPECAGAFNLAAPNPATNREFSKTLAGVLSRPCVARMPAPVLRTLLGEMARLVLTGQRAVPSALAARGFAFEFEHLQPALENLLKSS